MGGILLSSSCPHRGLALTLTRKREKKALSCPVRLRGNFPIFCVCLHFKVLHKLSFSCKHCCCSGGYTLTAAAAFSVCLCVSWCQAREWWLIRLMVVVVVKERDTVWRLRRRMRESCRLWEREKRQRQDNDSKGTREKTTTTAVARHREWVLHEHHHHHHHHHHRRRHSALVGIGAVSAVQPSDNQSAVPDDHDQSVCVCVCAAAEPINDFFCCWTVRNCGAHLSATDIVLLKHWGLHHFPGVHQLTLPHIITFSSLTCLWPLHLSRDYHCKLKRHCHHHHHHHNQHHQQQASSAIYRPSVACLLCPVFTVCV